MTYRVIERWLREDLIKLRQEKGWTIDRVVRDTGMHKRTIERVERGPDLVSARSLAALMHVYDVGPQLRQRLRDMQELAGCVGWWDGWHDIDLLPGYAEHIELEEVADRIDFYSMMYFNGLVQSPEYAAWMQKKSLQSQLREGPMADRHIQLRLARQERCLTPKRRVRLLIDETLLLTRRGPLIEQLAHLGELEERGILTARVLPAREQVIIQDAFMLFTAGKRKSLCLGFTEQHMEDQGSLARAQKHFELGWARSEPLFENGTVRMDLNDVMIDEDRWFKSARSANGGDCVQAAIVPGVVVGVRDSKDPDGGQLRLAPQAWKAFIDAVKNGEFDL